MLSSCRGPPQANVAELADAPDLGSGSRKRMGVRPSPFAPETKGVDWPMVSRRQVAFLDCARRSAILRTNGWMGSVNRETRVTDQGVFACDLGYQTLCDPLSS